MIAVTIGLEGMTETLKRFDKMPDSIKQALGRAIKKSAFLIERYAKMVTPVDTGRLRSSIFTMATGVQAVVSTNTRYAVYVHQGTQRMSARPFMSQGADKASGEIRGIVEDEISRAI